MQTRFVIGDTHFGHKNILEFEPVHRPFGSIEEHDEAIIDRWNSVVKKNDTVWHLGDVLFGKDRFELLSRLNGKKRLVMGNHDNYDVRLYLNHFERVCGAAKIDSVILSHVPIHTGQFYRFTANIHGHMHSKSLDDARYINVSAEMNNLTPIAWEEAVKQSPRQVPVPRS
jgi:calcineurin-like phosphoesterase family protein